MKTAAYRILTTTVVMMILFVGGASAQTEEFLFHWPPSPIVDVDGVVHPEAVFYEVWFQRGSDAEVLIGTTAVTRFIVQGEPDVSQRIRVRAVDAEGRQSEMSPWSDPIYFSYDNGIPDLPGGPELAPNYPLVGNEFNVTRAGIHADGLLKNEEVYNCFDTEKLLNRPIKVAITDKSGAAGVKHWIESRYEITIGKHDPRIINIKQIPYQFLTNQ